MFKNEVLLSIYRNTKNAIPKAFMKKALIQVITGVLKDRKTFMEMIFQRENWCEHGVKNKPINHKLKLYLSSELSLKVQRVEYINKN